MHARAGKQANIGGTHVRGNAYRTSPTMVIKTV